MNIKRKLDVIKLPISYNDCAKQDRPMDMGWSERAYICWMV